VGFHISVEQINLESEEQIMKTFEELTYFVDTKEYMKAYNKVAESIDNAELDKAKNYLSLLKLREQELIKRMDYELRTEREMIARGIGLKEGEY
jgi:hypothetical protein